MEIRRLMIIKDTVLVESGVSIATPVNRVAACAVIQNPFAGVSADDLAPLASIGADLGSILVGEANKLLAHPAVSYGKAAVVGGSGEIEHGAAIIHPKMGKPIRDALGGGKAIIPSNVKVAPIGATIDVPLGNKDDVWSFAEIDTMTISVPDAPRMDEIVVVVVLADRGRPRARV